jgi:hypothetical protein
MVYPRLSLRMSKFSLRHRIKALSLGVSALAFVAAQAAGTVSAHQSPGSCNANRFDISIVKDRTQVYQGQTLTYTVTANNVDFSSDIACDITGASIQVTLPAPDGTPTGQVVVLTPSQDFPAGSGTVVIGSAPYVVNVNPGVVDIVAEARAEGVLHDAPVDHAALIVKTIGTSVIAAPPTDDGNGSGGGDSSTPATPGLPNTGTAARP